MRRWTPMALLLALACESGGAGTRPFDVAIAFEDCDIPWTMLRGQCADVAVPLDWEDPGGPTITVHVRHLPASRRSTGQVWLLHGAPASSGGTVAGILGMLSFGRPDLDVFVMDRRGTGSSTPLGCEPPELAHWEPLADPSLDEASDRACFAALEAEHGEGLRHFGTAQAGRDLAAVVDALSTEELPLTMYAYALGAPWLFEALPRLEREPDSLILDAPCVGSECARLDTLSGSDEVGRAYLSACDADPACAARFGGDANAFVDTLFADVAAGHCPELSEGAIPLERLRYMLGAVVNHSFTAAQALETVYRYRRCEPRDVEALTFYWTDGWEEWPGDSLPWTAAQRLVTRAEGMPEPMPTVSELEAETRATPFGEGRAVRDLHALLRAPEVPMAPLAGIPETDVPVLLLSGTADPFTRPEQVEEVARALASPHAQHVSVTWAAEPVVVRSHRVGIAPCGAQVVLDFLDDPTAPIATACLDVAGPPPFELPADTVQDWFERPAAWE